MEPATMLLLSKAPPPMSFRIFSRSTGETIDTVEMHVLAKAYRAAWRSQFTNDPTGLHVVESLGLVIDFGGTDVSGRAELPDDSPFGPTRRRDWG